jgi:hypothetical protein
MLVSAEVEGDDSLHLVQLHLVLATLRSGQPYPASSFLTPLVGRAGCNGGPGGEKLNEEEHVKNDSLLCLITLQLHAKFKHTRLVKQIRGKKELLRHGYLLHCYTHESILPGPQDYLIVRRSLALQEREVASHLSEQQRRGKLNLVEHHAITPFPDVPQNHGHDGGSDPRFE